MKGRVLITGGIGLIGNALVKLLQANGYSINVLDMWDINQEGINYFKGSILEKDILIKAMDECDYVIHLAAILGVDNSTKRHLECLDVNIKGTRNVLDACVKKRVKKVIFSSSSETYGEPKQVPISESALLHPISEYGVSKVVGEEYVKAFFKEYGLNFSIARFFNVYGPIQTDNFVLPSFVRNAVLGKDLRVFGDGSQVRAFCYVEDAVRGILRMIELDEANGEIFNIGNSDAKTTILELAKTVLSIANSDKEPIVLGFGESTRSEDREIFQRIPDISKARRILGYEPQISLQEGIRKVYEHKLQNKDVI